MFNFSDESKSHVYGGEALLHSYVLLLRVQKIIVFNNVDMLENFTKIEFLYSSDGKHRKNLKRR